MSDVGAAEAEICRGISDDAQRLACYDQAFPRSTAPVSAPATAPASVPAAAPASVPAAVAPATQPARNFGLSIAQQRAAEPTPPRPDPDHVDATVSAQRRLATGHFVVTLDNGQRWQQTELDSLAWVATGDRVTIRRGALGSYLLVTPRGFSTRVRRLQ